MEEKLYTLQDIKNMIKASERTLRRHIKSGQLTGMKIGGEWRFKEENLRDYFNDKATTNEIVKQSGEVVKMFLKEGKERENDQVCMILDFVDKTDEQFNYIKQSIMDITSRHKGINMKLTRENKLIRLTLTGDLEFISECVSAFKHVF